MKFTAVPSTYDNRVIDDGGRQDVSWEEFVDLFSTHEICETKEDVGLIVPVEFVTIDETLKYARYTEAEAIKAGRKAGELKLTDDYKPYVHRVADNVKAWHFLPVDFDGERSIRDTLKQFRNYEYILYTSHSHKTEAKGYIECFRVLFPFKKPIPHDEFVKRVEAVGEWIGPGTYDESSLANMRAFYMPSCPKSMEDEAIFYHNKGKWLNPWAFPVTEKPVYVPPENQEISDPEKEMFITLLGQISQMDNEDWVTVATAMRSIGYTFEQFYHISRQLRSHRKCTERLCDNVWSRAATYSGGPGTMVNVLKEYLGADVIKNYRAAHPEVRADNKTRYKRALDKNIAALKQQAQALEKALEEALNKNKENYNETSKQRNTTEIS